MSLDLDRDPQAGLSGRLERLERPPVITMTTDFGMYDGYVSTMKGVIYTLLPNAVVVDISHDIGPQQIHAGAFTLYRAYRYFPAAAVHLGVVDPGVGGERRPIALVTRHGTFVGPDNGIFSYVVRAEQMRSQGIERSAWPEWIGDLWGVSPTWAEDPTEAGYDEYALSPEPEPDPPDIEEVNGREGALPLEVVSEDDLPRAYHLTNPDYWLPVVSNTFHGRDIFSPVAAHLASGANPARMGEPVPLDALVTLPLSAPRVSGSGRGTTITGQVIHIDRFGDIITNLPANLLDPMLEDATSAPVVEIGGQHIFGLATSYAAVREGQAVALMGSEGLLEVAIRNANAAQRMKVSIGDPVRLIVNRPDM
jgi:S-adenosylmethionine hydrolase